MIVDFFVVFKDYLIEVLPFLAIGLFLSGLIHEFIPSEWVERHLGGQGIKPILYSTLAGTILPICCFGSLPVAVTLYQKGARLGPVLAFLVATPATSITALLVTYALMGLKFTIFIFFAVIVMGVVMGLIGNVIKFSPSPRAPQEQEAIEAAPRILDPIQQTVITLLRGYLSSPLVERHEMRDAIKRLSEPMTHTAIRLLRKAFEDFQEKKDITALVKLIRATEKRSENRALDQELKKPLKREDLRLVCFDFVWS